MLFRAVDGEPMTLDVPELLSKSSSERDGSGGMLVVVGNQPPNSLEALAMRRREAVISCRAHVAGEADR